ncbi:MAG: hypothetical protein SXG53_18745 [Pseudomonadota bacterium]|nr:hypothetical protein [Pseudomonadota bacterium]
MAQLSKLHIATAQLDTAIALYLDGKDLISAITLAGAAEEILGKLAEKAGATSAFNETLDRLCDMHAAMWGEEANRGAYVKRRTHARNEFKHIGQQAEVNVDLEREAASMLRRAIQNYREHDPSFRELFRQFEREFLRRNAAKNDSGA